MDTEKSHVGMMLCFFCNKPSGVVLDRRLRNTLPRAAVYDHTPCAECKALMERGVILIQCRDATTPEEEKNPYRLGGWVVVTDDAIRRIITDPKVLESVLNSRFAFLPDDTWHALGLHTIPATPETEAT